MCVLEYDRFANNQSFGPDLDGDRAKKHFLRGASYNMNSITANSCTY